MVCNALKNTALKILAFKSDLLYYLKLETYFAFSEYRKISYFHQLYAPMEGHLLENEGDTKQDHKQILDNYIRISVINSLNIKMLMKSCVILIIKKYDGLSFLML